MNKTFGDETWREICRFESHLVNLEHSNTKYQIGPHLPRVQHSPLPQLRVITLSRLAAESTIAPRNTAWRYTIAACERNEGYVRGGGVGVM